MDGTAITKVLKENGVSYFEMQTADASDKHAYPFCTEVGDTIVENKEIPVESQMIALNEGINQQSSPPPEILGSPSPTFKHIVKLTATTSHPSLKNRSYTKYASNTNKNKIDDCNEWDDDEASPNPLDSSFLKKTKFDATAESIRIERNIKVLNSKKKVIERKVLQLRKLYRKGRQALEKEKINIERKTKRLRQKIVLLGSGQKLRHEFGLKEEDVTGLVAETVARRNVKSGLSEYVLHSKAAKYTGGLFAEIPSSPTSTLDGSVLLSPIEVTPKDIPKKARGRPRKNPFGGIPKVLTDSPQPKEEPDLEIENTSLQLDTSTIEEGICSESNMENAIPLTQENVVVGEEEAIISAESCLKSAPSEYRVSSRGVGLQRPLTKSLENGVNVLAANATTNGDFIADGSNEHVDHENIPLNEPLTDNGVQDGNNSRGQTGNRISRPTSQCSDADPPTGPLKEKDLNVDASNDSNTAVAPGASKKMRKELLIVLNKYVGPQSINLKSLLKETSSNMPSYSEKNETLVKRMRRSSIGVKNYSVRRRSGQGTKTPTLQEPTTPGNNKELISNEVKSESFLNKKKKRLANEMESPELIKQKRSKKSKMEPVEAVASTEAYSVKSDRPGSVASNVSTHSSQSLEDLSRNVKRAKNFMFKGVGNEKICELCLSVRNEATYQCSGVCLGFFHASCAENEAGIDSPSKKRQTLPENWQCSHCVRGQNPCFVCKESTGTRQMCLSVGCGKFYHHNCLKLFPQTKFNHGKRKNIGLQVDAATGNSGDPPPLEIVACARHTCHTCCSDNPNQCAVLRLDKLVTCIKCATSYHSDSFCLPACTEVLTTNSILCGKHSEPGQGKTTYHLNINWCFICTRGGSLICCDWCPSSIHAECLKLKPPEDSYACIECWSGRFPLHGEVVWVKLGAFRWWPSKVLYPHETPRNMLKLRRRQCEFAVMFFGTMNYQWVNRGRVFLYNEGDYQNNFRVQNRLDKSFQRALLEAKEEFTKRKDALPHRRGFVKGKPAPYKKIRSNKYRVTTNGSLTERQVCECSPTDQEPCGALSNCLNRVLFIECHPSRCPAGLLCCNQRFEKRQYPPLFTIRTENRGWGLQSTVDLVKGQFIIEYVGEVITDEELAVRLKMKQDAKDCNYYFLRLDNSRVIDAGLMGNNARFINHSCAPNCETQKWNVNGLTRIGFFACEDIPSGTELTLNYDMDSVGGKTACYCSASNCTGFIGKAAKGKKLEAQEIGKKKAKSKTRSKKAVDRDCGQHICLAAKPDATRP